MTPGTASLTSGQVLHFTGERPNPPLRRQAGLAGRFEEKRSGAQQADLRLRSPSCGGPGFQQLLKIMDIEPALDEAWLVHDPSVQGEVRGDTLDPHLGQRHLQPRHRLVPGLPMNNELGDHRVVVRRYGRSCGDVTVDPDAWAAWDIEPRDLPRGRGEAVGIFGIDPAFESVTMAAYIGLGKGEGFAARNPNAFGHDIDSGGRFSDWMLDLHPRIHLDEEEFLLLDQELEGADTLIADPPAGLDAAFADLATRSLGQARSWRFLQDLLMAALERAIAAAEPECRAVSVRQHLDLDVARMFQELFGIDLWIAEGAARFLANERKSISKLRTLL